MAKCDSCGNDYDKAFHYGVPLQKKRPWAVLCSTHST